MVAIGTAETHQMRFVVLQGEVDDVFEFAPFVARNDGMYQIIAQQIEYKAIADKGRRDRVGATGIKRRKHDTNVKICN